MKQPDDSTDIKSENRELHESIVHKRLIALIEFIQESAKLKLNPVKEVSQHKIFSCFEDELIGLPGIHYNTGSDDDEVWLVIDRLWESQPPAPHEKLLAIWLDISNKLDVEPRLKKAVEQKILDASASPPVNNLENNVSLVLLSEFDQQLAVESQLKSYIETQWKPWATEESKRRKTIKIYADFFSLKQQLEGAITDTQIEVVWGMGLGIWKTNEYTINYPLIIQLVSIDLNQTNMSMEIRPTQVDSHLELEVYSAIDNKGISELEKFSHEFFENQTQACSPFDPLSFEPLLKTSVTYLDPRGIYYPSQVSSNDRRLPKGGEELKVTNTWVIFGRPRSKNIFVQDLDNFKKHLEDMRNQLSPVVKSILTEPSSNHQTIDLPSYRGICTFASSNNIDKKATDLFFPMPYNQEQVNIVQRLECSDGVVVQGPPGTGKTHTIANIIAHYMANGKRVLVTSMKEPALSVLKEKLPTSLQPLVISLLASEPDGMKQFEFSISKIAQELQTIDRRVLSKDIEQNEKMINQLHGKLSLVDKAIDDWANNNNQSFVIDEESIYPETAARELLQGAGNFEWLNDNISIAKINNAGFDNEDIIKLRDARRNLGEDLDYLSSNLPKLDEVPQSEQILSAHRNLSNYNHVKALIEENGYPEPSDTTDSTLNLMDKLIGLITEWEVLSNKIKNSNMNWASSLKETLQRNSSKQAIDLFEILSNEIHIAFDKRNHFLKYPVFSPDDLTINDEIVSAIRNKGNDKLAFGLTGIIGKGALKKQLSLIRIANYPPKRKEDWQYIYQYVMFSLKSKSLISRWNNLINELKLPAISEGDPISSINEANEMLAMYFQIKEQLHHESSIIKYSTLILPSWRHHEEMLNNNALAHEFKNILDAHLKYHQLSQAWAQKEKLQNSLSTCSGRISDDIKIFVNNQIGDPSISELQLQSEWTSLIGELRRIHGHQAVISEIKHICMKISDSGALNWAKRLSIEPIISTVDHLLPDNWHQAWRLRRISNHLQTISKYDVFKKLSSQRIVIEKDLSRVYQETTTKRTWLKLADNATPDVKAALSAFCAAIKKIGKGTGKKAKGYRRDAKQAASKLNQTIPCWIMAHYRVSESLPPDFGCFDLVIIDEASQSDLSALPAIFRAKKLLIVGDDKQVSPEGIGLDTDKINNLMNRFLTNQVDIYRPLMSPDRSIYDLFKVVFADSQIMLREHFRCVGPIIEYSKREFYNHELRPIRLPKNSERLDPPLIDVLVEDGFRKDKVKENPPEARFIVNEIKKICRDSAMKNISIGVISLLGDDQARLIWDMLEQELGPDLLSQHKIVCGNARTFQGNEKNIIFLSMVVTKEDGKANSGEAFDQRFNVAASRARDRMYLVRSIEIEHLSPADKLRRNLIEHFAAPFLQDETTVKNLRELCESEFECEVYDVLTERGYKVIPQVKVGAYRIDMVVEGDDDTRLAIECDGDRYHDASHWEDDINRQRTLERVGWHFWRCFASTFVMHRDEVIGDLIQTIHDRGIEPIGNDGIIHNIHSEHRRVIALVETETNESQLKLIE